MTAALDEYIAARGAPGNIRHNGQPWRKRMDHLPLGDDYDATVSPLPVARTGDVEFPDLGLAASVSTPAEMTGDERAELEMRLAGAAETPRSGFPRGTSDAMVVRAGRADCAEFLRVLGRFVRHQGHAAPARRRGRRPRWPVRGPPGDRKRVRTGWRRAPGTSGPPFLVGIMSGAGDTFRMEIARTRSLPVNNQAEITFTNKAAGPRMIDGFSTCLKRTVSLIIYHGNTDVRLRSVLRKAICHDGEAETLVFERPGTFGWDRRCVL